MNIDISGGKKNKKQLGVKECLPFLTNPHGQGRKPPPECYDKLSFPTTAQGQTQIKKSAEYAKFFTTKFGVYTAK